MPVGLIALAIGGVLNYDQLARRYRARSVGLSRHRD